MTSLTSGYEHIREYVGHRAECRHLDKPAPDESDSRLLEPPRFCKSVFLRHNAIPISVHDIAIVWSLLHRLH
jgi:hypothetical protein